MINLIDFIKFYNNEQEILGDVKVVNKISTDTRTIEADDCFLALSGENFDGNKFLTNAIEQGATSCIYKSSAENETKVKDLYEKNKKLFFIGVDDTEKFFQQLARYHHQEWKKQAKLTFGITGSNGKTTTKELLAFILEELFPGEVLYTQGNLNNHLGLPMTQLRLKPIHKFCILEMGTNHPGEIKLLCELGDPDTGIITSIGQSHLEFFHNEENVFDEKTDLYRYVKNKGGYFSVDYDNKHLVNLQPQDKLLRVGFNSNDVKVSLENKQLSFGGRFSLVAQAPKLFGEHNFKNLALVVSILMSYFPEKKNEIIKAIEKVHLPNNNRSELRDWKDKKVFLDAYNANPSSMMAALKTFFELMAELEIDSESSLFVLGQMNELGEKAPEYHEEVGKFLFELGAKHVIFVGRYSEDYLKGYGDNGKIYKSTAELKEKWVEESSPYRMAFLKGSRTLQLESLMALN